MSQYPFGGGIRNPQKQEMDTKLEQVNVILVRVGIILESVFGADSYPSGRLKSIQEQIRELKGLVKQ